MIEDYFCNLARLSYLSRWRRDKKKGEQEKLSQELLRFMEANMHRPTM
jgi:hypothetical protein